MPVVEALRAAAAAAPASPALVWRAAPASGSSKPPEPEVWSYRDVWLAGSLAAAKLQARLRPSAGGEASLRVGVALPEGAALPLLELAVLVAGAAVVPLDPEEPPARLRLLAEDASLAAVVVQDATKAAALLACLDDSVEVCEVRELLPAPVTCGDEQAWIGELPPADAVSHVFFTSGSTGRPKGCVCTHGNLSAYCEAKNSVFSINSQSVVFVASAHTFDPSFGDFFASWTCGACVALAPRALIGSALGRCLQEFAATHLLATPALFNTLEVASASSKDIPSLAVVALGGELMSRRLVDAWASASPPSSSGGVRLLNVYGVTECTVYQASASLAPGVSPRLLQAAFAGTELFLASGDGNDPDLRVKEGSGGNGEIWIAGPQVGLGYLGRPELTEARFVERPGLPRLFRTGDIASAAVGGGWSLVGRRDGMVKLRGNRIELGEIEEVLLAALPDLLRSCAVVLAPGPRLVAWCVPNSAYADDEADAGAHRAAGSSSARHGATRGGLLCELARLSCEERLPRHMVPAAFALTASLPTTGTGKVSRRELAARALPEADEPALAARRLRTASERTVAAAWAEVLGVPVASGGAHFHALGGDSLAALRVCRRLAASLAPRRAAEADGAGGTAGAGGAFGELLPEPLLPASLLRQPRLAAYARQLQAAYPEQLAEDDGRLGDDDCDGHLEEEPSGSLQQALTSVLHQAAGLGDAALVRHLLARGVAADGASAGRLGRTPLHAACAAGAPDVVQVLLAARGAASASDGHAVLPLHLAAEGGSCQALSALLEARARLGARDRDSQTALHHAARAGAPTVILQRLLDGDRPVFTTGPPAGGRQRGSKAAGVQTGGGCLLESQDGWGRTALHWAVVNGHRTVVVWLLEAGADRSIRDASAETPLAIAERRAQCRAQDRPEGQGASVFGDIATLLGGSAATARAK